MVALIALAAAFCYALGAALQHAVAATRDEASAGGFMAALFRRPAWWSGNVMNAVGWALQATALAKGSLVFVQPMLLLSVVLSLPMTAVVRGERPGPREWRGALLLVCGVLTFVVATGGRPSEPLAGSQAWVEAGGGLVLLAVCAVAVGRRVASATMYAIASGLLFGLAAALTKATVASGLSCLAHWPAYALVLVTMAAFYWMQRAYQAGPLAASFPVIIALDPIVGVALGLTLFGEQIQTSFGATVGGLAGILLVGGGIATLARSRFIQA